VGDINKFLFFHIKKIHEKQESILKNGFGYKECDEIIKTGLHFKAML
jgi:hypothetical protein